MPGSSPCMKILNPMAVKISGVLKDGAGKPVQNCTIQLKAKRNSTTVVVNTVASENPDEAYGSKDFRCTERRCR
ncbi:prophage tail fiber N-terminal domain-containing protein [Escherichia coli]|uniref:prophage tail fiber N-terminal domain-containing protein n=1 Tax=Escherichia coli TaxID=562 RepID=UPI000B51165E|nr:hypothetical protein B7C52_24780 [Escherichia coli]